LASFPNQEHFMATKRKSMNRASRRIAKTARRSTRLRDATARQASPKSRSNVRTSSGKKSRTRQYLYYFGDGHADGSGKMKPLLGGKGANLAEMTRIGLPVPPGFTITTEVCSYFYAYNRSYPPQLKAEVESALAKVEKSVGKRLGNNERPLLVSVRSGARDSMPGMMDTILNLGMNDEVVEIVARKNRKRAFRLGFVSTVFAMTWRRRYGRAKAPG
jgi:pyruvate,orthophosphate dikinase